MIKREVSFIIDDLESALLSAYSRNRYLTKQLDEINERCAYLEEENFSLEEEILVLEAEDS